MRPVERGPLPLDELGQPKAYVPYRTSRDDLIERIGPYCSFCGLCIANPDVEHMVPKSLTPALLETWDNFLLACGWCNSTKGNKDTAAIDPFWPDRDNTLRAFSYSEAGRVRVNARLGPANRDRARDTADLVGLLREPGGAVEPTTSDRRWKLRRECWMAADRLRGLLEGDPSDPLREAIVLAAVPRGFLGVWLRVFRDHRDMRERFVRAFRGTATDAFTLEFKPKKRPNGQL